MISLQPPLRRATEEDAPELAQLVNFAGDGLPLYIWQEFATEGEDPWEIGRKRQASKADEGEIVVVDFGAGPVASLTGYVIGAEPTGIGDEVPDLFRPLLQLENKALQSWYVNVLACFPEFRGQGLGTQLLAVAEDIARSEGMTKMSVIIADDNLGAERLYRRTGYVAVASEPCLKEGWSSETENWILLTKPLD